MGKEEQNEFFCELHEHSKAKLELLKNYAIKWMRKVTLGTRQKKCAIIDTFAGTGLYDDGSEGSPIVLINEALNYSKQSQEKNNIDFEKIILIFIEKEKTNFLKLKENIEKIIEQELIPDEFVRINNYSNVEILISNDDFNNFTENLLKNVDSIIPTLMFVDPFGYKVLNYSNISKIIKQYDMCELIINFMYEEINRFFLKSDSEVFIDTLKNFYGPNFDIIKNIIKTKTGEERRNVIIDGYKENLIKAGSIYSLDFDIEKNRKVKMNMIFSTKNKYGFDVMKESMLDICHNTDFEYHTYSPQLSLFDIDTDKRCVELLSNYIYNNFKSNKVQYNSIKNFAMTHPFIPSKFTKKSLKKLELELKIVDVIKSDGSKRKKGTFPDNSLIVFKGEIS